MLSIYPRVSQIYTPRRSFHLLYPCISVHPPSLLNYILGGRDQASLEMHFEAGIEWTQRCALRPWSSEFGHPLGGRDQVSLEMHSEAVTERVSWCTWRPRWSKLRDALGGHDRASLDMHLEAKIEWIQRCTLRPRSSEFRDALRGWDRVNWEMHLEAMIDRVWRCAGRAWSSEFGGVLGGGQYGGSHDGSWDSIHWLTCNCGNVESWVQHMPRDEKLAGSRRLLILGWCCTWCMLYLVLTHDYGMERERGMT